MKLGILGGTFNPIHISHVKCGETVLERLGLDKVIFLPVNIPPHKIGAVGTSPKDRFEMTKMAIADNSLFEVSDMELKRGGVSYTRDTLQELQETVGRDNSIYWIIGGDSLVSLHTWDRAEGILDMANFVVVERVGYKLDVVKKDIMEKVTVLGRTDNDFDISSTKIRMLLKEGRMDEAGDYLNPSVLDYIKRNGLYLGEEK